MGPRLAPQSCSSQECCRVQAHSCGSSGQAKGGRVQGAGPGISEGDPVIAELVSRRIEGLLAEGRAVSPCRTSGVQEGSCLFEGPQGQVRAGLQIDDLSGWRRWELAFPSTRQCGQWAQLPEGLPTPIHHCLVCVILLGIRLLGIPPPPHPTPTS